MSNSVLTSIKFILIGLMASLFIVQTVDAQVQVIQTNAVGIGTTNPQPSAKLDVNSTNQGFLMPRMSLQQRNVINQPADGLQVFVTDPDINIRGPYYWDDAQNLWIKFSTGSGGTTGNTSVTVSDSPNIDMTLTGSNISSDLTTTGVTAGSYTSANIVVDQFGRLLSASDGGSAGSGVMNAEYNRGSSTKIIPAIPTDALIGEVVITPTSPDSKIYVSGRVLFRKDTGTDRRFVRVKLFRDGTEISRRNGMHSVAQSRSYWGPGVFTALDEPGTTSPVTYKIYATSNVDSLITSNHWELTAIDLAMQQGPIGAIGPQGPQGVPGMDGMDGAPGTGGVTQAGLNISVTGAGTPASPYIISNTFTEVDGSSSNELQNLSTSGTPGNITLSNGGGTLNLNVNDGDSNPTNELQTISAGSTPGTIDLSNGGGSVTVDIDDADADPTNEIQMITAGSGPGDIDLSNGGGSITIDVDDADANPTNELQTLSASGNTVSISNGNSVSVNVNDADSNPNNELQAISTTGAAGNITLNSGGGTLNLNVNDADSNPSNELQNLSISGNNLTISNGNTVALPSGGSQGTLSTNGTPGNVTLSNGGGTININVDDADNDPTNEYQTLSASGNTITISNGNAVSVNVNDADSNPTNEIQDISLSGNQLSITNGSTVTLPGGSTDAWELGGNTINQAFPFEDYLGTINAEDLVLITEDDEKLRIETNGRMVQRRFGVTNNLAIGEGAGPAIANSGQGNVMIGWEAGTAITTGDYNTFLNRYAGTANTTGSYNFFVGRWAGESNTDGDYNMFVGAKAGQFTTTGNYNNFLGPYSGQSNVSGSNNTFIGNSAGFNNLSASYGVYLGEFAGHQNTLGEGNVFIGRQSGKDNIDGDYNVNIGYLSGDKNTAADGNVCIGYQAGRQNLDDDNVVIGYRAGGDVITLVARSNVFIGEEAGRYADNAPGFGMLGNNFIGDSAGKNAFGGFNNFLGWDAGRDNTGNNNIFMGQNSGEVNQGNNNIFLGEQSGVTHSTGNDIILVGSNTSATSAGLNNSVAIGTAATVNQSNLVYLNSGNASSGTITGDRPYTNPSDERFKLNVNQTNVPGLNFITRLTPVTYNFDAKKYKEHLVQNLPDSIRTAHIDAVKDIDPMSNLQIGFIAQDVAQICDELGFDFDGLERPDESNPTTHYSIAYSLFVMPLVKATQEQQEIIERQEALLNDQDDKILELESKADQRDDLIQTLIQRLEILEQG